MKVLFLISDTGSGHRAVMNALVEEFKSLTKDDFEYKVLDGLKFSEVTYVKTFPTFYATISNNPFFLIIYNIYYKLTNTRLLFNSLTLPFKLFVLIKKTALVKSFTKIHEEFTPDITISIHPFINVGFKWLNLRQKFNTKYVSLVPDLSNVHYSWSVLKSDLTIAVTQSAYEDLKKRGEENLKMLGYPIDKKFLNAKEYSECTCDVLIAGGSRKKVQSVIKTLTKSLKNIKIIVVCGKDNTLKNFIDNKFPSVRAFGFVDNVQDYMASTKVVIGKAGPGIIMEAIFMKKYIIITEYVGEQERKNVDFVIENKYGFYCPNNEALTHTLRKVLNKKYQVAKLNFHYKYLTRSIVNEVVDVIKRNK